GKSFEVVTTETNRAIVTEALLNSSLGERLVVTRPVEATLYKDVDRPPDGLFPIDSDANVLADVIGGEASGNSQVQVSNLDRTDYRGGVALVFENLNPPQTVEEISNRLRNTRLSQF